MRPGGGLVEEEEVVVLVVVDSIDGLLQPFGCISQ